MKPAFFITKSIVRIDAIITRANTMSRFSLCILVNTFSVCVDQSSWIREARCLRRGIQQPEARAGSWELMLCFMAELAAF